MQNLFPWPAAHVACGGPGALAERSVSEHWLDVAARTGRGGDVLEVSVSLHCVGPLFSAIELPHMIKTCGESRLVNWCGLSKFLPQRAIYFDP
jgi:hypothetical protein